MSNINSSVCIIHCSKKRHNHYDLIGNGGVCVDEVVENIYDDSFPPEVKPNNRISEELSASLMSIKGAKIMDSIKKQVDEAGGHAVEMMDLTELIYHKQEGGKYRVFANFSFEILKRKDSN